MTTVSPGIAGELADTILPSGCVTIAAHPLVPVVGDPSTVSQVVRTWILSVMGCNGKRALGAPFADTVTPATEELPAFAFSSKGISTVIAVTVQPATGFPWLLVHGFVCLTANM